MPHLQEKGDDNAASRPKLGRSFSSGSELPITEAKEGFLEATEGLLTIRSMNMAAVKTSDSFGPSRTVSDDSSCTPRSHSAKQSVVTPSPFGPGGAVHHGSRLGPVMTIYGSTKLVPSPIRGKRRLSQSDDDDDEHLHDTIHMAHPRNLRYGDAYNTPTKPSLCHTVSEGFEMDEIPKKRLLGQLEKGEESPSKKTRGWNNKEIELEAQAVNDDATNESSNIKISPRSKKPIISPASSTEKGEDVEGATMIQRSEAIPSYGHGFAHQSYPPHRHPFPPGYAHSPFGTGYPMYGAYHPPMPPPHFMGRPTGAPGAPFYHPYPPHHPAMMHHFRRPPPAHPLPGSPHQMRPAERSMPSPEVPKSSPTLRDAEIKSVEEWRHAALTTGKPPCANRCVALKEPIPSKYWGNAEKTMDALLPDFHRLVNYPDYLVKSRNAATTDSNLTPDGKRNCVMCGKQRVCSATTYVNRGRGPAKAVPVVSSSSAADDDCSAHIIPRQNKGLCTACDVTVWVIVADGLEIKWCKGCKNFRPWAAFGDKGSATKCVRCRDRQREKYAMQKDEIRQRKVKRSASSSPSASEDSMSKEEEEDESSHMAAAHGLQTLINAATV